MGAPPALAAEGGPSMILALMQSSMPPWRSVARPGAPTSEVAAGVVLVLGLGRKAARGARDPCLKARFTPESVLSKVMALT